MHALTENLVAGRADDHTMDSIKGIAGTAKESLPHAHVVRQYSDILNDLHDESAPEMRPDQLAEISVQANHSIGVLMERAAIHRHLEAIADEILGDADPMQKDTWIFTRVGSGKETV